MTTQQLLAFASADKMSLKCGDIEVPIRLDYVDYESRGPYQSADLRFKGTVLNESLKSCKNINTRAMTIKKVIFNDPATIVIWADDTKTVVKAQNNETYDPEKGLAMAIAKKALGNEGKYYNEIKKWVSEYEIDKAEIIDGLKAMASRLGITVSDRTDYDMFNALNKAFDA